MKKRNYILKGARVIDPCNNIDSVMDIGISNGKIEKPSRIVDPEIIELEGKTVTPGLIDIHVHLRDPGQEDKETIKTGTAAAAAGGFTTIVAMPNTIPVIDGIEEVKYINQNSRRTGYVNVFSAGCITRGMKGREMTDVAALKKAGIVAVTDDGKCVQNRELMLNVLKNSNSLNIPVFDHCEDAALAKGCSAHEGEWAVANGLKGMPGATETIMVARDIILAEETKSQIHVQHLSSEESVIAVREARRKGIKVTAEATPHHIALTDECIKNLDANYKMNPPLRTEKDRQALIEGLKDGTITVIATDHAPHTQAEKNVEFAHAPFGVVGLETALPVCLTELYHKGFLTLPELISKFTMGPAEVLGNKNIGSIKIGGTADLTIIDPDLEFKINKNEFFSKSRNTPFNGKKVKGKAVATIVGGSFIYSELDGIPGVLQR